MKAILTLTLVVLSSLCYAQKHNTYFIAKGGRYVNQRDSAEFIRIVSEPDSGSTLYNVSEFDLNGKIKSQGQSRAIDPPRYDGLRITYYATGKKESILNYKNGTLVDAEYQFYPNGKPYFVLQHPEDTDPGGDDLVGSYSITSSYDSTGAAGVVNGNGDFKRYDSKFKLITEAGSVKDGKMDGEWTGTASNGKQHFIEKYDNGTLITGTLTDEAGVKTTYTKNRETNTEYAGGLKAFYKYIGKHIEYPDRERENGITGKVILSFVIEKDGKVSDVKILRSVNPNIDNEAMRVIKHSRPWTPATQFGRPVRTIYVIPIDFSLQQ